MYITLRVFIDFAEDSTLVYLPLHISHHTRRLRRPRMRSSLRFAPTGCTLAVVLAAAFASMRLHRASAVLATPVLAKPIVAQQRRVGTTAATRGTPSFLLTEAHDAFAVVLAAAFASMRLHRASAVLAAPVLAKPIVAQQWRVETTAAIHAIRSWQSPPGGAYQS
jgi:hypothetical protein